MITELYEEFGPRPSPTSGRPILAGYWRRRSRSWRTCAWSTSSPAGFWSGPRRPLPQYHRRPTAPRARRPVRS
ncbi:hypothetical protein ACFQ60_03230 [Streptomyces zhihengii]